MKNDVTIISKLIDEAKEANQKQANILSELNKGNIDKAVELTYLPSDLNKVLHTYILKVANLGPDIIKSPLVYIAANLFVDDFAKTVGEIKIEANKELSKALTDFFGVTTEYKDGSIISKTYIPADKLSQVVPLLDANKVLILLDENTRAEDVTKSIGTNYHDNLKSWYEQAVLVHEIDTSGNAAVADC